MDAPHLEFLYKAWIDLEPPEEHGDTPEGRRRVHIIRGGTIEGPHFSGRALPGGGNWGLGHGDGTSELNVHCSFELDDGALLYVRYRGSVTMGPAGREAAARGETPAEGDYYFYITPQVTTSDERLAWINGLICVGRGIMRPQGPAYEVFAVNPDVHRRYYPGR